jgi:hypothetical protein
MLSTGNRPRRRQPALALRWMVLLSALAVAGCTALPRRDAPPTLFSAATPVGFPAEVRFLSSDRASVEKQSAGALQQIRASSRDGIVRALVLSGGGAGGAFGAGALQGEPVPRPDFVVHPGDICDGWLDLLELRPALQSFQDLDEFACPHGKHSGLATPRSTQPWCTLGPISTSSVKPLHRCFRVRRGRRAAAACGSIG